jgi:hypothetical protein
METLSMSASVVVVHFLVKVRLMNDLLLGNKIIG